MAIQCGEHRLAEQLIARGLAGNPPAEIAEELRDLYEEVNFERHLETRRTRLGTDELQISINGNATSHGLAQADQVLPRVEAADKLIVRTIERLHNKPFRDSGKAVKEITENYELYLSVPRAASFAITLRLGRPGKQKFLPVFSQRLSMIRLKSLTTYSTA